MSTPATATAVHQDTVTAYGAANTLVKPSARRVLGELTPNTRIESPNLHHGVDVLEALKGHSPLKQVQSLSPVRPLNAENWPDFTISGIGRKRSINEVDGAVAREEHRGYTPRRHDERETYLRDAFRPASRVNMCGHTSPSIMNFQDDDLSSTDVGSPELEGNVSQETSATKASFSSLIDYNPQGSSLASQHASSSPPEMPESLSEPHPCLQQAETLRLRLRIALYKVRTNQTNIPLSELALPTPGIGAEPCSLASPSRPPVPSITISSTSPSSSCTAPATTIPKLLPAPVLLPTAYSSRHITEPYLPSSPPASVSSEQVGGTSFATPVAQTQAIEQLSSPPESEERNANGPSYVRRRGETFEDAGLTSSIVTGRAASGLLELMHAT